MNPHRRYMNAALALAQRNLGQTWPNPSVGALIVKNDRIIAQAHTARTGRPHAETLALAQAGANAHGATLYVTLEPCSHHGQTPPCTDAIIKAGIATVVIACRDPNPLVNGQGIAQLKAAGIEIIEDIGKKEALALNRGFFSAIEKKRPFISLKLATSLDGKIAMPGGESQWITGESARRYGHLLRSRYDAIATGTALADNPTLTCRLPGLEKRSPLRIVFDRQQRLPVDSHLVQTAGDVPLWVLSSRRRPGSTPLPDSVRMIGMDPGLRRDDELTHAATLLAQHGITRLLIEAGSTLSTAFLHSGLVDRIYWFRAPIVIGNEGLPALNGGFAATLDGLARWRRIDHITLQPDTLDIYECSPASSAT
jgi:diaminohydroxyphosphoribosylaminopyrimidine deaminase/5-amino-6-(5-phosphoribosylamino)uracil reductase